jgi:hypothetical protein
MSYNVIQYLVLLVSQFQAITWGILSLLGILVYTEVIDGKSSDIPLILFLDFLIFAYFNRTGKCMA